MRKRETFFLTFFLFLLLSLGVFALDKTGMLAGARGILENITNSLQRATQAVFRFPQNFFAYPNVQKLQDENAMLLKKLVDQKELQNENSALKDQFQTSFPKSQQLLPAKIIGSPGQYFVIDKGQKDGVKIGLAVVLKDVVMGKVSKVSSHLSVVTLINDALSSFTALDHTSSALGVVKGQGSEMILDNVLLSENLNVNDVVVTKGDVDAAGIGFPPNLVVGKITSVDKKPSSLFQSAKVKSPIDFSKLTTVFVITGYQ